jgi:hypothetical protein
MLKQAPVTKRFIAFIIDWYIASLLGSVPVIIFQSIQGRDLIITNTLEGLSLGLAWTAGIAALLCHFFYYCIVPYRFKNKGHTGQTLGWRMMRLQLLPSDKVRVDATRGSVSKGVARVDVSLRDTAQGAASVSLKSLFLRHMIFFVLLQGYLTTSNIYIITLIKMSFHIDVVAYSQTFYYITSLISLAVYFLNKRKQLLQDKLSQTMLYEIEPVKEPHNLSSLQKHANALKMP